MLYHKTRRVGDGIVALVEAAGLGAGAGVLSGGGSTQTNLATKSSAIRKTTVDGAKHAPATDTLGHSGGTQKIIPAPPRKSVPRD